MAYDLNVARTAYSTARTLGASDKVMLALFEAGIVESGMRNIPGGDRDSVGFLQQRPSQGWKNPTDVPTATRSFVTRAQPIEGNYATAGQLAQAVQRSAFPLRYDAARPQAQKLLNQVKDNVEAGAGDVPDIVGSVPGVAEASAAIKKLTDPNTYRRVGMFLVGFVMLILGMMVATRTDPATLTKAAVKIGKKVVT